MGKTKTKKVSKIFVALMLVLSFISMSIITPMEKALSFDQTMSCTADKYGKDASTSDNGIDDMICTVYNLATGKAGKVAAISLMALGFVRGSGMMGSGGGFLSATTPFLMGVGLAASDGLSSAVGYEIE